MLTLVMNAAEKRLQFLLLDESGLLCGQDWLTPSGATEMLAPAIDQACANLELNPSDIARVACVAGPGSFTGIRLVLATAAALARSNNARQAGLNYLQCLAAGVYAAPGQSIMVTVRARQNWCYCGLFRADAACFPQPEGLVSMRSHAELAGIIRAAQPDYLLGSALRPHPGLELQDKTKILPPACDDASIAGLLRMAGNIDWAAADSSDIEAIYIRESDAMDNFDAIAAKQGLDPAKARDKLARLLSAAPS